jgi:hypothetical protein
MHQHGEREVISHELSAEESARIETLHGFAGEYHFGIVPADVPERKDPEVGGCGHKQQDQKQGVLIRTSAIDTCHALKISSSSKNVIFEQC